MYEANNIKETNNDFFQMALPYGFFNAVGIYTVRPGYYVGCLKIK